jgi:hypothetical protein
MKFVLSLLLLCIGLSFLGESANAQQSKTRKATRRNASKLYKPSNSLFLDRFPVIAFSNRLLEPANKKFARINNNQRVAPSYRLVAPSKIRFGTDQYSQLRGSEIVGYGGTYWQAGCGAWTIGRIHQGSIAFFTVGAGWSFPRCSYQKGVLRSKGLVQSGISINGTAGGLFWPVVNKNFASYTRKGFKYFVKDGLTTESVGRGSPQLGLGLSLTIRTE